MKNILIILTLIFSVNLAFGQNNNKPKIYNPDLDANIQLKDAVVKAKKESKHVLIQIGGNWCSWCIKFHEFINDDKEIKAIVEKDYVYMLLNIDRTHHQKEMMKKLKFPQRFGYPVFVILDAGGNQLHIQDSALLEKDKSYDIKKVKQFLLNWNKEAISPESYK